MARIIFVTHPDVVIDPAIPVPQWPLSQVGRARMAAFAGKLAGEALAAVWTSQERKALDGGEILSAALNIPHHVDDALGENDRSSTGYLEAEAFWPVVQAFFAHPDQSVQGWETARHAQARIVAAVSGAAEAQEGDIAIVSHGGVARLLTAHLQGVPIGQEDRPRNPNGGCFIVFDPARPGVLSPWAEVEAWPG
jgi:broad specificity phosphatase PhoE